MGFLFLTFKFNLDLVFPVVADATKLKEAAKLVPLHTCIFSDQLTPITVYRWLGKEDDSEAPGFLFESVEPGSQVSSVLFGFYGSKFIISLSESMRNSLGEDIDRYSAIEDAYNDGMKCLEKLLARVQNIDARRFEQKGFILIVNVILHFLKLMANRCGY
ncbi:hypothetical protein OIU77_012488 [Salix suchowensis]|uniref:Uncharacterized protein n=1 Tax=Salix suchowensis TaxID=1278906 RepID=A0ABQ9A3V9_9ROSI|nr:hypothetical protein OIU77_012488 [Salix suchowensis]